MSGLDQIKYPVNNDRRTRGGVYPGDATCIKDADGTLLLNVMRYSFPGKDGEERRQNALRFTRALVNLLNTENENEEE